MFSTAEQVLAKLLAFQNSIEKMRYLSDVLLIFSGFKPKLVQHITKWIFVQDIGKIQNQNILIYFLKRSLFVLRDFDECLSKTLTDKSLPAIVAAIAVLKTLIIEEKVFSLLSFPKIVEKLLQLADQPEVKASLNIESNFFLSNLVEYVKTNNSSSMLKFKQTCNEREYQKLFEDIKVNFATLDQKIFDLALSSIGSINSV